MQWSRRSRPSCRRPGSRAKVFAVAPKSRQERLFGAACLKKTLAENGSSESANSIYQGALTDLGLTDEEVDVYLREHEQQVEAALVRGGAI